jgi:hypothetical protein
MPPRHHSHRHSTIVKFVDPSRIDGLLAPWISDVKARAFVVRCILDEGPAHHRGANFVLLSLLGKLVEATGPVAPTVDGASSQPIPLRLPPHLAEETAEKHFPLELPTRPLEHLAPRGSPDLAAMAECLSDGPPQHCLANAAMVALIGVLLERAGVKPA